jgi:hypothetical protein
MTELTVASDDAKRIVAAQLRSANTNQWLCSVGSVALAVAAISAFAALVVLADDDRVVSAILAGVGCLVAALGSWALLMGHRNVKGLRRAAMFFQHPTQCTLYGDLLTVRYGTLHVDVVISARRAAQLEKTAVLALPPAHTITKPTKNLD